MTQSDIQAKINENKVKSYDLSKQFNALDQERNSLIQQIQNNENEILDLETKLAETPTLEPITLEENQNPA